jgi:hypothetical protein
MEGGRGREEGRGKGGGKRKRAREGGREYGKGVQQATNVANGFHRFRV